MPEVKGLDEFLNKFSYLARLKEGDSIDAKLDKLGAYIHQLERELDNIEDIHEDFDDFRAQLQDTLSLPIKGNHIEQEKMILDGVKTFNESLSRAAKVNALLEGLDISSVDLNLCLEHIDGSGQLLKLILQRFAPPAHDASHPR